MSQRIPQAMAEKFAAVTALTDAFCEHALNDEYRQLIHRLVGTLARKRPSPLLRGTEKVWAAAAVGVIMLGTAAMGFCPIYRLLGINTCRI